MMNHILNIRFVLALGFVLVSGSAFAVPSGPEMEMVCRGGGAMTAYLDVGISGATATLSQPSARIIFTPSPTAAQTSGFNLQAGQCSFIRRPIAANEPHQLKHLGLDVNLSSVACYSQCPNKGPKISSMWDNVVTDFTKVLHLKVQLDGSDWVVTGLFW